MTDASNLTDGGKPCLHVLMVEDLPADFELVMHELRRSGLRINARRVETEVELVTELQREAPDVVLSDHACGAFDSFGALAQVRVRHPDVPFILVTGALSRQLMCKALDRGVDDWVSKSRLSELMPVLMRALRLAEERVRLRLLEAERDRLRTELAVVRGLRGLNPVIPICASCKKIRDGKNEWVAVEQYLLAHYGVRFSHGLCLDCVRRDFPRAVPEQR